MSQPDERPDEPLDAEIVPFPAPAPGAELVPVKSDPDDAPWPSTLARRAAAVAERPILPSRDHAAARTRWWARTLGRDLAWVATHPHRPILAELRPIAQGVRVTWAAWREWVTVADMTATARATPETTAGKPGLAKELERHRSARRKISAAVALPILATATAAGFWWRLELALALIVAVCLADIVGRRHPDPDDAPPPVRRTLLEEGAPLGALTASIIERLNEDGVRADPASAMRVHAGGEYRLDVTHEDAIEPKHLRSLERHLAARRGSIRIVGSEDAGTSELRLPTRDHLKNVPQRPWAPTGSRSITEPADLWVRDDGDPSRPILAGIHVDLVGTTGAGKTEALQELISFYGECADVYPVFADLTRGPVGGMNRRVLRRHAYTEAELDALLDWVLAIIEERHIELHRLAESDDDEGTVEWDLAWGPQIQVVIDEYSFVAEHDELHNKVEKGMRIGRKVKVCFVRASQRSGNRDLGSTVAQALVGIKILLACTERDTTSMLSTGHRDLGWSPHLFRPAVPGDPRDAGKCFVWGPAHRDPEIHRFHTPLPPGEVKRRDRRRATDGLPNLDGTPAGEQPAILLSPVQTAVEEIFTARELPWLPTAVLLAELADRGHTVSAAQLGDELGNCGSREPWEGRQVRGYRLADVHRAWGVAE